MTCPKRFLSISLLIFLCRISFVLSDFQRLNFTCTTENNEHMKNCTGDLCKLEISLTACDTLQMQCTDIHNNKIVCNSLEECGMTDEKEFVNNLLGYIQCDLYKDKIECVLSASCKDMVHIKHVCKQDYCGMRQINNSLVCKFSHNIEKCIHGNEKFPINGNINCTSESTEGQAKTIQACTPEIQCIPVISSLAVVAAVAILVVIILVYYMKCKRQDGPVNNPPPGAPVNNTPPDGPMNNPPPDAQVDDSEPAAVFRPPEQVSLLLGDRPESEDTNNRES
ncbi:uncharacterized protein LOC122359578 isoform X2 [Puntigrus tetrazona]|uniref:uncharacterized protein LOC122359578 isoform X2 n=1 Tax=Puntigrus tetrazona TaxID=1606681 RepID=UPI001C8A0386|nr:uncharacterized protein LOC122359578 isoform X2 [Puntigrus tetrazona]